MKNSLIYKVVDNVTNEIKFQGSYDECVKHSSDSIVYVGEEVPKYHAVNNSDLDLVGTMEELSEKLKTNKLTLYNYTRYRRRRDGLFLKKV